MWRQRFCRPPATTKSAGLKAQSAPNIKRPRPADGGQYQQTLHQRRKRNCPAEPPALTSPEAKPRLCGGTFAATCPMMMENRPRQCRMQKSSPIASISPNKSASAAPSDRQMPATRAAAQHLKRAETVGKRARKRLGQAPINWKTAIIRLNSWILSSVSRRRTDKQSQSHAHADGNQQDGRQRRSPAKGQGFFAVCHGYDLFLLENAVQSNGKTTDFNKRTDAG